MADQVGWGTPSKIVLWVSVAFVILYIVMSGIYWRQYVAAKTVDPNGDIVSLWSSFPLFTFLWSFAILGFVMFLLWRAHTTDVIFGAAAGVGTFLSQGYAERFGPDKETYKSSNKLKDVARRVELAKKASEKAVNDDKNIQMKTKEMKNNSINQLDKANRMVAEATKNLNNIQDNAEMVKSRFDGSLNINERAELGIKLAKISMEEAKAIASLRKAEDNLEKANVQSMNVDLEIKRLMAISANNVGMTSAALNREVERFNAMINDVDST